MNKRIVLLFLMAMIAITLFSACESEVPLGEDKHSVDTLVILDSTFVYDTLWIIDTSFVYDTTVVYDSTFVYDTLWIIDTSFVYDSTIIIDTVFINDTLIIYDSMFVYDTLIIYDSTVVIDTVFINDSTVTYNWQFDANLKAGPYDKFDSKTVNTCQESNWNQLWFYIKMDVPDEYRGTMTLEFVYADGSRRYWQIPDVLADRPAYILVDGGEALIEPIITINWYYPGGINTDSGGDVKCDYWNRLIEISGSREIPANRAGVSNIQVEGTSQRPNNL